MKSWKTPTAEIIERTLLAVKTETDRQYFFAKLQNPLWLAPLKDRECFKHPPAIKHLPDGYVQFTVWPEIQYLKNICLEVGEEVVAILNALPETDNPRIYDDIIEIALTLKGSLSAELKSKIIEYTKLNYRFFSSSYADVINHWIEGDQMPAAIDLAKVLVILPASHDPNSNARGIDAYEYQQLLKTAIRPLAEKRPYEVTQILIEAMAKKLSAEFKSDSGHDFSEVWCKRLWAAGEYDDSKAHLLQTLTYAAEQVYRIEPTAIIGLDKLLKDQRWAAFKRVLEYLYGQFPSEQTKPWIQKLILSHATYAQWIYHYEFQKMTASACQKFGATLLSESELTSIFEAILSGPSEEKSRERMGDKFVEDDFKKYQNKFHIRQLRPFSSVLFGQYQRYYDDLIAKDVERLADDDYLPAESIGGFVSYRSPKSIEDLEKLSDEELLALINSWDEEYRDPKEWLIEINISALAGAFEVVFRQKILADNPRLEYWKNKRANIARPIYVRTMLKALQEEVKLANFEHLPVAFDLCRWLLAKPEESLIDDDKPNRSEESAEHPTWLPARRAVVDFIGICVSKETPAPLQARTEIATLLEMVCMQGDQYLDNARRILTSHDEPLTEAINNTRSLALEDVIDFGFWVRRHNEDEQADVPEVIAILGKRIKDEQHPLTRPEYALLGTHFGRLTNLNKAWAEEYSNFIFPKEPTAWQAAFGAYLKYNSPYILPFHILRKNYIMALERLDSKAKDEGLNRAWNHSLGEHLFMYYVWNLYPLTGPDSPLNAYYNKTEDCPENWAHLFNHAGHLLRNTTNLDNSLKERIIAFCEWRIKEKNKVELTAFTFWLEAECFDAKWRLDAFSRILDVASSKDVGTSIKVDTLAELLPTYPAEVIECFTKLLRGLRKEDYIYIRTEKAKPILSVGLTSEDTKIKQLAEEARDLLLRAARFDFMKI